MVGLGMCVGIVFIREKMDKRVTSPRDARQLSNLPQLGVIPSAEKAMTRWRFLPGQARRIDESESAVLQEPLLVESFRSTLASLMRESAGARRPQVILVTSPGPEEGQTTIASNLGKALAETGQRVLVFDGDFRRPRAHKAFGIPNTRGLVDLLADDSPIAEYPKELLSVSTSVTNLHVLPNGSRSEILMGSFP